MTNDVAARAQDILNGFLGKAITSVVKYEYQMRLIFGSRFEFVTASPWRILRDNLFVFGSGDVHQSNTLDSALENLKGLRFVFASVSPFWETKLSLENDYVLEVIPDSVQYETWEAHLEIGWVIFAGGEVTVFPPAPVAGDGERIK